VPVVVITIMLILRVVPEGRERDPNARVDVVGAALCALGLAGITFGLIEQPLHGWSDPVVSLPLAAGALLFGSFLVWEDKSAHPMLPLSLFRRRNFAAGNLETFLMYGGLGLLFFFLILFLQQVAGFSALEAGSSSIPVTALMFALSMRFGALADKHGPRFFMGFGPLIAACGMVLLALRVDADAEYFTDVLPGLVVFGVGLSVTVAPLTATVLADADDSNAGIASGVNNAIARVASLVAIAAVGAVVAASFGSQLDERIDPASLARPEVASAVKDAKQQPLGVPDLQGVPDDVAAEVTDAATDASVHAFHVGIWIATALVAVGGVLGLVGIVNPRRRVEAVDCPGGQFVGQPRDATRQSPCDWGDQAKPIATVKLPEHAEA
jgi:hypothetical protein